MYCIESKWNNRFMFASQDDVSWWFQNTVSTVQGVVAEFARGCYTWKSMGTNALRRKRQQRWHCWKIPMAIFLKDILSCVAISLLLCSWNGLIKIVRGMVLLDKLFTLLLLLPSMQYVFYGDAIYWCKIVLSKSIPLKNNKNWLEKSSYANFRKKCYDHFILLQLLFGPTHNTW